MSADDKDNPGGQSDVSSLLKRLRTEKAPWYFEAGLKRQLSSEKSKKRPLVLRPVFALPVAGAAAAVVLYLSVPPSGEILPDIPTATDSMYLEGPADEQVKLEESLPVEPMESREVIMLQSDPSPRRGPSVEAPDSYVPATVTLSETTGHTNPANPSQLAGESGDTSFRSTAEPDSADSLTNPQDSLDEDK